MNLITYLIFILCLIQSFEIIPRNYLIFNNLLFFWGSFLLFLISFVINFNNSFKYNKSISSRIFLLIIALFFSFFYNNFQHGSLALFIVFFGYHFMFLSQNNIQFNKLIHYTFFILGFIYCVIPVIVYFTFPNFNLIDPIDSTFRGFASHRNSYGYMVGLFILIILIKNIKSFYVFILPLTIGLFLSQSRSSLIALLVSFFYYKISNTNYKKILIIISILLISVFYLIFSTYSTRINDEGDIGRLLLINDYLDYIFKNPTWGYGGDYQIEYFNTYSNEYEIFPAHNTVLQVWASFGIIVLFLFINLLYKIFILKGFISRSIWIYLFLLSMFQPTLSIGVGTMFCLIAILATYYQNIVLDTQICKV
jgi:hypothetical protein